MNHLTHRSISQAIEALLSEYIASPLRYLREYNQQVRLGQLIADKMQSNGLLLDSAAAVTTGRPRTSRGSGTVHRIQHELKLGGLGEISDTVLLRSAGTHDPIRLTRAGNGHLDIVAAIDSRDVEAVIEIKAACSADPEQRHLFRSDVGKLKRFHDAFNFGTGEVADDRAFAPLCYFVLIDKSIAIPPHSSCAKAPVSDWHLGAPYKVKVTSKRSKSSSWKPSPQLALQPAGTGPVYVWDINCTQGYPVPRHRVCLAWT